MDWNRIRWWLLVALAGTLLLAGCLGDSGQPLEEGASDGEDPKDGSGPTAGREDDPEPGEDAPELETHKIDGTITADAWYVGVSSAIDGSPRALYFDVPADATTILAEFRWSGEAGQFNLNVFSPEFCPYSVVGEPEEWAPCQAEYTATGESEDAYRDEEDAGPSSSGELVLKIPEGDIEGVCDQDTCEWQAYAEAVYAADAEFDLRVTVVHQGELPEGYSAFEDADQA